ncbi:MAG: hypothetical protein ACLFU2_05070 [Opitutales bacterium]
MAKTFSILTRVGDEWGWHGGEFNRAGRPVLTASRVEEAVGGGPRTALVNGRNGRAIVLDADLSLMAKEVRVPRVAEERQRQTILHEVAEAVPFPLEEVLWDAPVLEVDAIEERRLLLAAREAEVVRRLGPRRWEGSARRRLETLPIALLNLLRQLPEPDRPGLNVYPAQSGTVLLFAGGAVPSVRIAPVSPSSVLEKGGGPRLQGELTRSIAAYRRQHPGQELAYVRFLGVDAAAYAGSLKTLSGLPCSALDSGTLEALLPGLGLAGVAEAHRTLVAGLVCGLEEVGGTTSALRSTAAHARAESGPLAAWVSAAAGLCLLAGVLWWYPAWEAVRTLRAELAAARDAQRPLEAHAAELAVVTAEIEARAEAVEVLSALARSRHHWTNFLVDLQARLMAVENIWIDRLEVLPRPSPAPAATGGVTTSSAGKTTPLEAAASGAARRLRLEGRLLDPAHPLERVSPAMQMRVNELFDGLAASPYVEAVEDKRFETLEGGLLQFGFTLKLVVEGTW